jgi:hypothetical protein
MVVDDAIFGENYTIPDLSGPLAVLKILLREVLQLRRL